MIIGSIILFIISVIMIVIGAIQLNKDNKDNKDNSFGKGIIIVGSVCLLISFALVFVWNSNKSMSGYTKVEGMKYYRKNVQDKSDLVRTYPSGYKLERPWGAQRF